MSRQDEHSAEIQELIRRGLEGELTAEDRSFLEEHPEVAAEIDEIGRLRGLLNRSVDSIDVPEGLAASIRRGTLDAPDLDATDKFTKDDSGKNNWFWVYSAAAALAVTVAIWASVGVFDFFGDDSPENRPVATVDTGEVDGPSNPADAAIPIPEILQVGMTDHMRCAVTFFAGEVPAMPPEKMKMSVGEEYVDLIPIVDEGIDVADLVVSHRCSFFDREYVHLVLKNDTGTLVSVAITAKFPGESLQGRAEPDTVVDGRTIFRTEIEGFEIAGFESGEYLVFVASNLSVEENLRAIGAIVGGVRRVLAL